MPSKYGSIIRIICMMLIGIAVFFFIDWPFVKTVNNIHNALRIQQQTLQKNFDKGKNFTSLEEDYHNMAGKLPACEKLFMPAGKELDLIKQLEVIAAKHNLTQHLEVSPAPVDLDKNLQTETIAIDLRGDFSAIAYYLKELKNLTMQLAVNAINIDILSSDGNGINAKLLANSYWLKAKHSCK